jgi:hypothetical protein
MGIVAVAYFAASAEATPGLVAHKIGCQRRQAIVMKISELIQNFNIPPRHRR